MILPVIQTCALHRLCVVHPTQAASACLFQQQPVSSSEPTACQQDRYSPSIFIVWTQARQWRRELQPPGSCRAHSCHPPCHCQDGADIWGPRAVCHRPHPCRAGSWPLSAQHVLQAGNVQRAKQENQVFHTACLLLVSFCHMPHAPSSQPSSLYKSRFAVRMERPSSFMHASAERPLPVCQPHAAHAACPCCSELALKRNDSPL